MTFKDTVTGAAECCIKPHNVTGVTPVFDPLTFYM